MSVLTHAPSATVGRGSAATITVAAVEDQPVVALGLAQMLAGTEGITFVGTYPSMEALLADPRAAGVRVVLADPQLAGLGAGSAALARLESRGTAVLAFPAAANPYLQRMAAESGMVGTVSRTADPGQLRAAVRAAAGGLPPALPARPDPALSRRERETLALYASGEKSERVAELLGISQETVNDYIGRVRAKYRRSGRAADTKVDLYKRAVEDGILPPPGDATPAADRR